MTPGISAAKRANIKHKIHEYDHDPTEASYGLEAAEKLGISEQRVFKTLVVSLDKKILAVAIIPVNRMLSMKLVAKTAGVKKATMAEPSEVQRSTGYVLGGVSPLGQKRKLKTMIDASAKRHSTIYVSAGRRGLEIELRPTDLMQLVAGNYAELCS